MAVLQAVSRTAVNTDSYQLCYCAPLDHLVLQMLLSSNLLGKVVTRDIALLVCVEFPAICPHRIAATYMLFQVLLLL